MKEKEDTEYKIEVLAVTNPPLGGANIARTIGAISGLVLAVIGAIMIATIILIIPGIFTAMIGLVVAVLSAPKAHVDCPACGTDNKVALKSKQLKCAGCETATPLKWEKREGNKLTSWSAWKK